jgi:hypothetical protein
VMPTPPFRDAQGQVHVDINLETLKCLTIQKATEAMDVDPVYSRTLLESALQLYGNDMIIQYNLACSAACERNRDAALMWLEAALAAGYQQQNVIENDHDLDYIREDPKFVALMNSYFPQTVSVPATGCRCRGDTHCHR